MQLLRAFIFRLAPTGIHNTFPPKEKKMNNWSTRDFIRWILSSPRKHHVIFFILCNTDRLAVV